MRTVPDSIQAAPTGRAKCRGCGRAIAKAELLDHVWDNAADVGPNAVEVYIGYLRRKIGSDRLITVRGVGYRLAS